MTSNVRNNRWFKSKLIDAAPYSRNLKIKYIVIKNYVDSPPFDYDFVLDANHIALSSLNSLFLSKIFIFKQ